MPTKWNAWVYGPKEIDETCKLLQLSTSSTTKDILPALVYIKHPNHKKLHWFLCPWNIFFFNFALSHLFFNMFKEEKKQTRNQINVALT